VVIFVSANTYEPKIRQTFPNIHHVSQTLKIFSLEEWVWPTGPKFPNPYVGIMWCVTKHLSFPTP